MKKANIVSIIFFLSITGYVICGGAVEVLFGEFKFVDLVKIFTPVLFVIFFLSAVLFYILNKFIWADGQRVQSGTKLFNGISIAVIIFSSVFGLINAGKNQYAKREEARIEREKIESMTEEEKSALAEKLRLEAEAKEKEDSRKQKIKEAENSRFTNTLALLKAIKENMREPNSFDLITARANENGSVVCVEYRGKNGFGGYSKEFAVYANKKISQNAEAWNKHCVTNLIEMKHVKYAM